MDADTVYSFPLNAVPGKVSSAEEAAALKGLNAAAEEAGDEGGVVVDHFDSTAEPGKQLLKIESVSLLWYVLKKKKWLVRCLLKSILPSPPFWRSFHLGKHFGKGSAKGHRGKRDHLETVEGGALSFLNHRRRWWVTDKPWKWREKHKKLMVDVGFLFSNGQIQVPC